MITIREVARAAGVSGAARSRALNASSLVTRDSRASRRVAPRFQPARCRSEADPRGRSEADHRPDPNHRRTPPRPSRGVRLGAHLLQLPPRPAAIFAANDSKAIGAQSALRDAGLRVPEDMALAGFDDLPMSQCMTPALPSVPVDIAALGARAATRLLETLARPGSLAPPPHRCRETLATTLVVRRCSGAHSITTSRREAV